ncbi:MAG TPA: hypothetical protein DEB39_14735 [Planctomycetaceae bacterium]|nr:hypothetical protein [Planctomycetaceae bacterium]
MKDTSAEKPRWKIGLESAETAEKRKLSDGVIYEFIFSGNGLPTKKVSIDCKATDRRRYIENATGYSNVDIHVLPGAAGNHRFDMVQILPESYAQFSGLPLLLFHLGNFLCIAALPFVPFLLFCGYKTCRSNPEIPRRWGTILVWPFYRNGICTYLLFSLPIIGFALFGAYMIMRAETGYYRFHDTLDGCVSLILSQVNQSENVFMLFARRPLDSIMCGSTYCTLPNFVILLFYIFSLIPALAVNFSVVHIIAYVGMYLLLTRHVVKDDRSCMTGIMVAFLFSCFGFYEVMGITIAGIPLLTYSLLNLFTRCYRWWDWVILLVVPSYMFAACSLIFLIAIACQCWILACIWNRKPNWIVLLGIAVVTLSWVVNERDMISRSLKNNSTGYVSFRTQFEKNNIDQVKSKPLINLAGFNYDTYIKRYEILRVKLRFLDEQNAARQKIAQRYLEKIVNPAIVLPVVPEENVSTWHIFAVRTSHRDEFQRHLAAHGVGTVIHYPIPPHHQDAYAGWKDRSYPISERIHQEVFSLPLNPTLLETEMNFIVDVVNDYSTHHIS